MTPDALVGDLARLRIAGDEDTYLDLVILLAKRYGYLYVLELCREAYHEELRICPARHA